MPLVDKIGPWIAPIGMVYNLPDDPQCPHCSRRMDLRTETSYKCFWCEAQRPAIQFAKLQPKMVPANPNLVPEEEGWLHTGVYPEWQGFCVGEKHQTSSWYSSTGTNYTAKEALGFIKGSNLIAKIKAMGYDPDACGYCGKCGAFKPPT